jgi:hypothetical protein
MANYNLQQINNKLFDVKLNTCLDRLRKNSITHPQLTFLWHNYLITNELTEHDLICCSKAIENMDSIPDISIDQLMIFKEIIKFLCYN